MHRSSKKLRVAPVVRPPQPRERTTEPWRPRRSDLCAERLEALAVCAALHGPFRLEDGTALDESRIAALADAQRAREMELQRVFESARASYEGYHSSTRPLRDVLSNVLRSIEHAIPRHDTMARSAFRLARRHSPSPKEIALLREKARERKGG